jgi:hypothetical protein
MQPIKANPGSEGLKAFKILMNTACASLIQVNIAALIRLAKSAEECQCRPG